MFRNVPNVPCSGFYRRPDISAALQMLLTRVRMHLQYKLPWYLMFKVLGSITILVFYMLRLLKIWKTIADVFKTELTYAMSLRP